MKQKSIAELQAEDGNTGGNMTVEIYCVCEKYADAHDERRGDEVTRDVLTALATVAATILTLDKSVSRLEFDALVDDCMAITIRELRRNYREEWARMREEKGGK